MAHSSAQVSVSTTTPTLLFRTSTGIPPDPKTTAQGGPAQIFMAHSFNSPLGVVVLNTDKQDPIYLGGPAVSPTTGTQVVAGGSLTFNVVGNQSLYAIATGGPVATAVLVNSDS